MLFAFIGIPSCREMPRSENEAKIEIITWTVCPALNLFTAREKIKIRNRKDDPAKIQTECRWNSWFEKP